jgi:hypothetical protein
VSAPLSVEREFAGYGLRIVGSVVRGRAHQRAGTPCQDRVAWYARPPVGAVAVSADGAGSAPAGGEGAHVAVNAVVGAFREYALSVADTPGGAVTGEVLVRQLLRIAHAAVAGAAEAAGRQLSDFNTTIALAVALADTLYCAQIGDGVVAVGTADAVVSAAPALHGRFEGETYFLTSAPELIETVAVSTYPLAAVRSVTLSSDGLVPLITVADGGPFAPFHRALAAAVGAGLGGGRLAELVAGLGAAGDCDDDLSVVAILLRQPEEDHRETAVPRGGGGAAGRGGHQRRPDRAGQSPARPAQPRDTGRRAARRGRAATAARRTRRVGRPARRTSYRGRTGPDRTFRAQPRGPQPRGEKAMEVALSLARWSFTITAALLRAVVVVARTVTNAARAAVVRHRIARSLACMRRGYLLPGDPPPVAGGPPALDYRGMATDRDLGRLALPRGRVGFGLGVLASQPASPVAIAPTDLTHAIVVGGPGSGKSFGLVVPWICAAARNREVVVALDVKGDLHTEVLAEAVRSGRLGVRVGKWDLADPRHSVRWNWLGDLDDDGAYDAAITAILGEERPNSTADPMFYRRDRQILRGLLKVAPLVGAATGDVRPLVRLLRDRTALLRLVAAHPSAPGVDDLIATLGDLDGYDHVRAVMAVSVAVDRLADAGLRQITTGGAGLDDLLATPGVLVVATPLATGEAGRMASALLLNLLTHRLLRRQHRPVTAPPCRIFVDEAARLVGRFAFEASLSVSRSAGVSFVLAVQDVTQFADEHERSTILNNCATAIVFPASSAATVRWLQERTGRHAVSQLSLTQNPGTPVPTLSVTTVDGPVLGDSEILRPPLGIRPAIVHCRILGTTGRPLLVDLAR